MVKYRVTLAQEEREELLDLVGKGSHKSQKVLIIKGKECTRKKPMEI